jgi:tetratricopeptide (TPR) repeat protein
MLHGQFASCLQNLRPGDYRSRVRHLLAAGEIEHAAAIAACALLQDTRNGVVSLDETTLRVLVTDNGLMDVLDCLCQAHDRIQAYDFPGAISLLSFIDPVAPSRLQAEAAYIRAIAWIKEYRYDARDNAIKDLQAWIPKITDEGEIAVRMLSTQLVALVHQRHEDDARDVEREIVHSLSLRAAFDPDALDALSVLDRKADLLYPAEQSYPRLTRSKNHFMPQHDGQPRNFYQYCASSLNLAANRIVCGEYEEALTYLREITSFLNTSPDHRFTRFEVLTNNLIVAEFLGGIYDAATAAACFERLVDGKQDTMDFCLIQSNYGASAAMAGDLPRAKAILQPLVGRLKADAEADDLHVYLAGTNLASVLYLNGECSTALELSRELENIVDIAMPPHRPYFRKRHDTLHEAMESGIHFTVADWNHLPMQATLSGPGPSWKHYGRGFLFTDLQIFTES